VKAAHTLTRTREGRREFLALPRVTLETSLQGKVRGVTRLALRPITAGASREVDLVVEDSSVSRVHCEFALRPEGVVVRDLDSKNGTWVRGVRIREAVLWVGDAVTLGQTAITVKAEAGERIELPTETRFGEAVGASASMRLLFEALRRAATGDHTVLLVGESGTGKDVLARGLHAESPRARRPFVVFDCSAVAPSLVEAELFGHVKGAFSGADTARVGLLEQASGGTLFLDEVGELPLELQPKLLRVLETRQVRPIGSNVTRAADVRVVAATHRDLQARVAARAFREDLYFRLAVVVAEIPPLRERREDLPLLVAHFLARQTPPRRLEDLPQGALELLESHGWPGNVRELWNTVTRLMLFPSLGPAALSPETGRASRVKGALERVAHLPLKEAREAMVLEFELAYLELKLKEHGGQVAAAAEAMGVSRQFLYRLLHRHGLKGDGAET